MSHELIVQRDGRVVTLTLNRPPLNILDLDTLAALRQQIELLDQDEDLAVMVLRGAGEKAFSAGVSVRDHTRELVPTMLEEFHAHFAQPEIELGCFPPLATALYPKRLGAAKTFDLLLTGRSIDCNEAEKIGFVSRQVSVAQLEAELERLVDQITRKSLPVVRLLKRAILAGRDRSFDEALAESERLYLEELIETEDMHEGLAAFLEKRPPNWKNR